MANRKRPITLCCPVTAEERNLIKQKMAKLHTKQIDAYLRKMAIDKYIIYVDTRDIKGMNKLLPPLAGTSIRSPNESMPEAPPSRPIWRKSGKGWVRYGSYKGASYKVNDESGH